MTCVFVSGTDTGIGKTLISAWLCLHTGFQYFKPIQTGCIEGCDSEVVRLLSGAEVVPEVFSYDAPLSPHLAACLENEVIDHNLIELPVFKKGLIIEGAGGLLVPINEHYMMIDLIKKLGTPVLLVSSSRIGTINHTLLSLEALKARNIPIIGVVVNGVFNQDNCDAISFYGRTTILVQFPQLDNVGRDYLQGILLPWALTHCLGLS